MSILVSFTNFLSLRIQPKAKRIYFIVWTELSTTVRWIVTGIY